VQDNGLKKGVIDFGILLDNSDLSSFHCEAIYQGEYRLYVSKKCKKIDSLSFLLDSEERTETNLLKKAYKKLHGKDLPVLMEISSWEVVANLTAEGLGIGFFPDYIAFTRKNLIKPHPHNIISVPYRIYAVFADNGKKADHITDFLQLLKNFPKG
jgi:DNA-binding transcriptional LysR family regulator